jgi:hypothetical protein
MHRTLLSAGAAGALALAAAAPALATPAPPPATFTAGQLIPPALSSAGEYAFGHQTKQLPTGTAAEVWTLDLVAGGTTDLTMACPTGTVVTDINITGPTTGYGETTQLPDFTPWYGQNAPSVSFGTRTPGQLVWAVLCLPSATATTTVLHGRSPVDFAANPMSMSPGVKKGAKLPKGAVVLKSTTTSAVNAGGTYVAATQNCPAGTSRSQSIVTSPGNGATGGTFTSLILYPAAGLGSAPVSIYALCAPMTKPAA